MSDDDRTLEPPDTALGVLHSLLSPPGVDEVDEFDERDSATERAMAPPVHWPSLDPAEAADRLRELRVWVETLQVQRFPEMVRLPDCWDRHPYIVELLQAVYDHERASFSSLAPPTAAVGWHMVLRDVEARLRSFLSDIKCRSSVAGGGHTPAAGTAGVEEVSA